MTSFSACLSLQMREGSHTQRPRLDAVTLMRLDLPSSMRTLVVGSNFASHSASAIRRTVASASQATAS